MTTPVVEERRFEVAELTRVEGEGSLRLVVRGEEVVEAHFGIFEAPRYFEALLVGRTPDEAIDITARICGICPVAYQMSAAHAFEDLFGIRVDPAVRALRRLFYCGEWIESHALHIWFLHAPDFLGYDSGIAMAADHRDLVTQALAIKKVGNEIVRVLGGRPIHPVSVRVGGWSHVPRPAELSALLPALEGALASAVAMAPVVASFPLPAFDRQVRLVSLRHAGEYPFSDGRIVSSDGIDIAPSAWRSVFREHQEPGSNALHARVSADESPYLVGPAARISLAADQLHPLAGEALVASGLREVIASNVYASAAARSIELIHALAEAIDQVRAYRRPDEPQVGWQSRPGTAAWATEAPRGLLFHSYEVDEAGRIRSAQIVPPTAQNQGAIEADLRVMGSAVLNVSHEEATLRLEQLIRSYDPCISCATHFLDLRIDRA